LHQLQGQELGISTQERTRSRSSWSGGGGGYGGAGADEGGNNDGAHDDSWGGGDDAYDSYGTVRLPVLNVAGASGEIARILAARDHFAVLEVARDAEATDIKRAFRQKQVQMQMHLLIELCAGEKARRGVGKRHALYQFGRLLWLVFLDGVQWLDAHMVSNGWMHT
jgi:hypothetical protein